ncbi:IPP transferase-domain-containing protein [Xylariales sp. AK1849]|nr:IPP transferase-domain-containing protein [Xylariales sp. AK1849]
MTLRRFLSISLARNAANMSTPNGPKERLVAIMGTTGTGKSDLAVDLAVKFNGEIINADAMQMYKGLPVITNQISAEERRGIPHHLLATIEVDQPTWTNGVFAREATKLIREIRGRGKLPIVVGGTHYYTGSLLFEGHLVDSLDLAEGEMNDISQTDIGEQHAILDAPTDFILKRLREVDPAMASRWHPDDRRKIRRSLEIFLRTGRRASDIYADQQAAKSITTSTESRWEALMFWVYSKPDVLKERLDRRVDKMERNGLMNEVRDLHRNLLDRTAAGEEVDRTRGIWQSIGFKQFEPFLVAQRNGTNFKELEKLRASSIEDTKIATRQYARYQLKWLRTKTIPSVREKNALQLMYLLDSSDAARFSENVLSPATDITQAYLGGHELPNPLGLSETASEVLSEMVEKSMIPKPIFEARLCDVCNVTLVSHNDWAKHMNSARHRRGLKHKSRTALVPLSMPAKSPDLEDNNELGLSRVL